MAILKPKILFMAACKHNPDNPLVQRLVKSIKEFQPNDDIFIMDSCSPYRGYLEDLRIQEGVFTAEGNVHYVEGALWAGFHLYPDYDYYFILHDSAFLTASIDEFVGPDLVCASWFQGPHWCGGTRAAWSAEIMEQTDYEFQEGVPQGVYGGQFLVSKKMLNKIKSKKMDLVLPTNKSELEAMERIWGMVFIQEGFPPNQFTINGLIPSGGPVRGIVSKDNPLRQ